MGFQKIIAYKNPRDGAGGLLVPQCLNKTRPDILLVDLVFDHKIKVL